MKKKLFLMGMAALALTFGLVLASCGDKEDEGGGGDQRSKLNGTWTKDDETNPHTFEYTDNALSMAYFKYRGNSAQITGKLKSYDGTTVKLEVNLLPLEFTATVEGNTLTISGLTGSIYSIFNGTYTKTSS